MSKVDYFGEGKKEAIKEQYKKECEQLNNSPNIKVSKKDIEEVFIGRENIIDQFKTELVKVLDDKEESRNNPKHTLNFYGDGGLGKTAVIRQILTKEVTDYNESVKKSDRVKWLWLDLDRHDRNRETPSELVRRMMIKMENEYKLGDFPLTKYLLYRQNIQEGIKQDIVIESKFIKKIKNIFSGFSSLLSLGNPVVGAIVEPGQELVNSALDGVAKSEKGIKNITIGNANREDREDVEEISNFTIGSDFDEKLQEVFIKDLSNITKKEGPFIFVIDTFEYRDSEEMDSSAYEDYLGKFLSKLSSNVPYSIWIISGRFELETSWDVAAENRMPLRLFSDVESDEYFKAVGIDDKKLRERFKEISKGSPFILHLLSKEYNEILSEVESENKSEYLNPDNYGNNSKQFVDKIKSRYRKYFKSDSSKQLFDLLVSLDYWTDEMVLNFGIKDFNENTYNRIKKLNIVKKSEEGRYCFAQYIRESLLKDVSSETKVKAKEGCFKYLSGKIKNSDNIYSCLNEIRELGRLNLQECEEVFVDVISSVVIELLNKWNRIEAESILLAFRECYSASQNLKFRFLFSFCSYWCNTRFSRLADAKIDADECLQISALMEDAESKVDADYITADYLYRNGLYKGALETHVEVLEARKDNVVSKSDYDTEERQHKIVDSMLQLGNCYRELGNLEKSLDLHKEALSESIRLFDDNSAEEIFALNDIAKDLIEKGIYEEAIHKCDDAYEKLKFNSEINEPKAIFILLNKALCYFYLDRLDEAKRISLDCESKLTALLSAEDLNTLVASEEVGWCCHAKGEKEEALEKAEFVLKNLATSQLRANHPRILQAKDLYAECLRCLNKVDEAKKIQCDILSTMKEDENISPLSILKTKYRIATCVYDMGLNDRDYIDEALLLFYECYTEQLKEYKVQNIHVMKSLLGVADCLYRKGSYLEALGLYDTIYNGFKKIYGEKNKRTLYCLYNKAYCLRQLGEPEEALELLIEYTDIQKNELDFNPCFELIALLYLMGLDAYQSNNYDAAIKKYAACIKGIEAEYPHGLGDFYEKSLLNLGISYFLTDQTDEAIEVLEKYCNLVTVSDESSTEEELHDQREDALFYIGLSYNELGNTKRALDAFEKCYAIKQKYCVKTDPLLYLTEFHYAQCLVESGRNMDAIPLYEECIKYFVENIYSADDYMNYLEMIALSLSEIPYDASNNLLWNNVLETYLKYCGLIKDRFGEFSKESCDILTYIANLYIAEGEEEKSAAAITSYANARFSENGPGFIEKYGAKNLFSYIQGCEKYSQNKFSDAIDLFIDCCEKWRKTINDEDDYLLDALFKLSYLLYREARDEEALPYFKQCYISYSRKYGEYSSDTLQVYGWYSKCLECFWQKALSFMKNDNPEKAIELFIKCNDNMKLLPGKNQEFAIDALMQIGFCYKKLNIYASEVEYFTKAYQEYKKLLGDTSQKANSALYYLSEGKYFLGKNFKDKGEYERALPYFKECYQGLKQTIGEKQNNTIRAHLDIAECTDAIALKSYNEKNYKESLMYSSQSYSIYMEIEGDDYIGTVKALNRKANCLFFLEKYDEAAKAFALLFTMTEAPSNMYMAGFSNLKAGKFELALKFFSECKKLAEKIPNKSEDVISKCNKCIAICNSLINKS